MTVNEKQKLEKSSNGIENIPPIKRYKDKFLTNNRKYDLTEFEISLLKELLGNPRMTIVEISKKINKSRKTISKKIKELTDAQKIRFSILFDKNYFNFDFYSLQINIKRLIDAEFFIKLLKNCPRTMFCTHIPSYNMICALLIDEKQKIDNNDLFSCLHLIHRIQADSRISGCEIHPRCNLKEPTFISIDRHLMLKNLSMSPCGENCGDCTNYMQECVGCLYTRYYAGKIIF